MDRVIRWYDYITINIYWFALTTRSQVLTPLVIPLLVQQFIGESQKGTYVGIIRLYALMIALLMQALMGMVSDRTRSRFGRRRPYILIGTVGEVIVFILIGFSAGLEGMSGYWVLFGLYILSMLSSNTAHAATQGLIPDLVPEEKRGLFSGVKAMFELPVPLIFVSFVIGSMISQGNLWGALITLSIVMIICTILAMGAPETQLKVELPPLNWQPFLRLLVMTVVFTLIILGMGEMVKWSARIVGDSLSGGAKIFTGGIGLLGMLIAVAIGVWVSIRISIGADNQHRYPSFTWWVVNRLAFLVGATNLAGFMVFFLQERFPEFSGERAAGPAAQLVMFVGIFILLSALPSGWLADRFGRKPLVVVAGLLASLGTLIVIVSPTLGLMFIGGCFVGAGVGLFYSANWALGTDIVPKDQAGRFLGIQNLAGAGAGAIGAYLGGPIGDQMGYVVLMSIYGIMLFLSIFALRGVEEKANL